MKNIRHLLTGIVLGTGIATTAMASAPNYNVGIPPSVTLKYDATATYNGMSLSGTSTIQWTTNLYTYSIKDNARISIFGNVLSTSSTGQVDKYGLKPSHYTERKVGKSYSFSINQASGYLKPADSDEYVSFSGRTQDHSSIVWQLSSIANANRKWFVPGKYYTIQVAGHSSVRTWRFDIVRTETIKTDAGSFRTTVVSGHNGKNQTMTVWFATDRYFYPVQLYFNDNGNFQTRQTLSSIH